MPIGDFWGGECEGHGLNQIFFVFNKLGLIFKVK